MRFFFYIFTAYFLTLSQAKALSLSPDLIIQRIVANSLNYRIIENTALINELDMYLAQSVFNSKLTANLNYENATNDPIKPTQTEKDRTLFYDLQLSKKFKTGTLLSLGYERTTESSILSPFLLSQGSLDSSTTDIAFIELKQDLIKNSFGRADRNKLYAAQLKTLSAQLDKFEATEQLIIEALQQFWETYISYESLKVRSDTRDRYKKLVVNVIQKSRYGSTSPGEKERAEAEYEEQEQSVQASNLNYLKNLDLLLQLLQLPNEQQVEFKIPSELTNLVKDQPPQLDKLRAIQTVESEYQAAELNQKATESETLYDLKFIGKQSYLGVDESTGRAFADMNAFKTPTYFIGLSFIANLDSDERQGRLQATRANAQNLAAKVKIQREQVYLELDHLNRKIAADRQIAESMRRVVVLRQKALTVLEQSYRQGRSDITDLILANEQHLDAQVGFSKAIAEFYLTLSKLLAAKDQLIPPNG